LDDPASHVPRVPEDLLWAYELDLLEPDERDAVMEMIAVSEETQRELEAIRSALAMTGQPSRLEKARAKGAEILKNMMDKKMMVFAIVVRVGEELLTPFLRQEWSLLRLAPAYTLGPRTLKKPGEKQADVEKAGKSQDIQAPDGTVISVRPLPGDRYEVQVTLPEGKTGGRVQFKQLIPEGTALRERSIGMPQTRQPAVLSPCSDGLLKIVCPDAEYVIALGSSPDATEEQKETDY